MSLRQSRGFALTLIVAATFVDVVAYSIAVPVLPDLGRKLGASPTMIGFLFASFGVTLFCVSIPMGAVSDRLGRRKPLLAGLAGLAAASVLLAVANSLPLLFIARLAQGAADAVTWVVGFALLADLYEQSERGRASGIVMAGSGFAFMIGPSIGGWLYEIGGVRLPFLIVAAMAMAAALALLWLDLPTYEANHEPVPILAVVRVPAVAACAAAVATVAATLSMLEPVVSLQLQMLSVNPGRIGLVFGAAAAVSASVHPLYGRLADRWGARRLTLWGLGLSACGLPIVSRAWNFESALVLYVIQAPLLAMAITPSLAYMAEAASSAGLRSFGVGYGLYNVAWSVGLLGGPALGGFLFERMGFAHLALWWAPVVIFIAVLLRRTKPGT